ncbi:MAG: nucleoside deaminase [Oscillospiraceae bacterium]|jgi:tRNA(adenine34) deaminase|nr:nucleoside deaminase [Oscillospiraceae bacterium]
MREKDTFFMRQAIELAKISADELEVPVGAVIVCDGEIISVGRNKKELNKNVLCHAEIEAINSACTKLKNWRLCNCELFVTLEPCLMCTGAIINSRISRLIYGASDLKSGVCESSLGIFNSRLSTAIKVEKGILEDECSDILKNFFVKIRK